MDRTKILARVAMLLGFLSLLTALAIALLGSANIAAIFTLASALLYFLAGILYLAVDRGAATVSLIAGVLIIFTTYIIW